MDEKKRIAMRNSAKRLLDEDTPEFDIIESMKDFGLSEQESKEILAEVKPKTQEEAKPSPAKKEMAAPLKAIEEEIPESATVAMKEGGTGAKTFIPKLRTGGREKIREIMVDSPIGKKEKIEQMRESAKQADVLGKIMMMEHKIEELEKELVEKETEKKPKTRKKVTVD